MRNWTEAEAGGQRFAARVAQLTVFETSLDLTVSGCLKPVYEVDGMR